MGFAWAECSAEAKAATVQNTQNSELPYLLCTAAHTHCLDAGREATHSAILARIPVDDELSHFSNMFSGFRSPVCMWRDGSSEHKRQERWTGHQNVCSLCMHQQGHSTSAERGVPPLDQQPQQHGEAGS